MASDTAEPAQHLELAPARPIQAAAVPSTRLYGVGGTISVVNLFEGPIHAPQATFGNSYSSVPPALSPVEPPSTLAAAAGMLFTRPASIAIDRPSGWLDPSTGVVPVRRRPECDALIDWCTGAGPSIRLVCGPGGQGKTELARQLCTAMTGTGWLAGFLRLPPANWRAIDERARRGCLPVPGQQRWSEVVTAVRAAGNLDLPGVLMVVDYAENVAELLPAVVEQAMAGADPGAVPLRVLLLSRSAEDWWTELVDNPALGRLDRTPLSLQPLQTVLADHGLDDPAEQLWDEAVRAFAAKARASGYTTNPPEPAGERRGAGFATTLDLYAQALISVVGGPDGRSAATITEVDPISVVADHEEHLVARALTAVGLGRGADRHLAVTVVMLRPSATTADAAAALTRVGLDVTGVGAVDLVGRLAALYPPGTGDTVWQPPRPDRLADTQLLRAAARSNADWASWVLAACAGDDPTEADPTVADHSARVLVRALSTPHAAPEHLQRLEAALAALLRAYPDSYAIPLTVLEPIRFHEQLIAAVRGTNLPAGTRALSTAAVQRLDDALQGLGFTTNRLGIAVAVSQRLVDDSQPNPTSDPAQIAGHADQLTRLSRRLAEAGTPHTGLQPAQHAVELLSRLAASHLDDSRTMAGHAAALANLGDRLADHRDLGLALAATSESVAVMRRLVQEDPDHEHEHELELAGGLRALAVRLIDLDRAGEAIEPVGEAIDLLRAAEPNTPISRYRLAAALGMLAEITATLGTADPVEPASEAVAILDRLADEHPFTYRPNHAAALLRLASHLAPPTVRARRTARTARAVELSRQGVAIYQHLAKAEADAYQPELAKARISHSATLSAAKQHADALTESEAAIALLRSLTRQDPTRHRRTLAGALTNRALQLADSRRAAAVAEAVANAAEAVAIYRQDAIDERRDLELAAALTNHAHVLARSRRNAEAIEPAAEAVAIHTVVCGEDSRLDRLIDLADAATNLALHLVADNRRDEAIKALVEAVAQYEQLPAALRHSLARRTEAATADLRRLHHHHAVQRLRLRSQRRCRWHIQRFRDLLPGVAGIAGPWRTDPILDRTSPRTIRDDLIALLNRDQAAYRPGLAVDVSASSTVPRSVDAGPAARIADLVNRATLPIQNALVRLNALTYSGGGGRQVPAAVGAILLVVTVAVVTLTQTPGNPSTASAPPTAATSIPTNTLPATPGPNNPSPSVGPSPTAPTSSPSPPPPPNQTPSTTAGPTTHPGQVDADSRVLHGHTAAVYGLAFSPDGKTLASGSDDTSLILWNAETGEPRRKIFTPHNSAIFGIAYSPDGTFATGAGSSTNEYTVRLWDATGTPNGVVLTGTNVFADVAYSPDGRIVAGACTDGLVRLWDAATGQPTIQPLGELGAWQWSASSLAFSPDGKTLATSHGDNAIRLWDVATGHLMGELTGHAGYIHDLAFSHDGIVASASWDGTVRLWNVATRQQIGEPLRGHTDRVETVAFSPDGKVLVSGGEDTTIRLWNVKTHEPIGTPLTGHTDTVWGLAFSPDGRTLASASRDATVQLWNVTT